METKRINPRERVSGTLRALKHYRTITDEAIAVIAEMSRSKVQSKMAGTSSCDIEDLAALSRALDVDPGVLFMESDEAIRWAMDNRPNSAFDLRDRSTIWYAQALIGASSGAAA